jgi:hypothetical protein
MAIDFGSYGFDYTRDLCSAIERYTANAERRRAHAFFYRRMQLRYAVERQIYIQCINSEALFQRYLVLSGREMLASKPLALGRMESEVAALFPGLNIQPVRLRYRVTRTLYLLARRVYSLLRNQASTPQAASPTEAGPEILIHIINAKFTSYLAPITQRLPKEKYAYLAACNHELGLRLKKSGFPVINWSSGRATLKAFFSSSALDEFSPLMREADATLEGLMMLRPKCVLVVEGNAPLNVITSEACKAAGIPCFCIQQGWSPYIHSGFRNMTYTEMFVWGERFAQLLKPYNPDQVFRVTGSHIVQRPQSAAGLTPSARTLSFFLQAPCALLGIADYDAFLDLITEVATAHPQIQIVVRAHPGYPLPPASTEKFLLRSNVRFSDPATELLTDVISVSEMVISVFSTVLLEAIAIDVVPLICSIGSMRRYEPDLASLNAAIEVQSIADARHVIDEVIADPARLDSIRRNLPDAALEFFSRKDAAMTIAQRLISTTLPYGQEDPDPLVKPANSNQ